MKIGIQLRRNKMAPKYKHDCSQCTFLGHFANHDVYVCQIQGESLTSLIARYGDDGPEYASCPVKVFQESVANNYTIGGSNMPDMPYQEYLFSPYISTYEKAWTLALMLRGFSNE